MQDLVERALEEVRPLLAMHKGNIELDRVDEATGIVYVRFLGTCDGCALAEMTLKMGVEALLKDRIPQVKEVVAVNS